MKRKRKTQRDGRAEKRANHDEDGRPPLPLPLLQQYYPQVGTLRHFLASSPVTGSKRRRRTIVRYGLRDSDDVGIDPAISALLDKVVVGSFKPCSPGQLEDLELDITTFTQQVSESSLLITATQGASTQSEIVDFVLWHLFKDYHGSYSPKHMLCRGYQRYATDSSTGRDLEPVCGVPGLFCNTANPYVESLKQQPWNALPSLLGSRAVPVLTNLFLHCALFQPIGESSSLCQICGVPLSDLKTLNSTVSVPEKCSRDGEEVPPDHPDARRSPRGLADIKLARHRMMYAKPEITKKGNIRFGLPHVHALNARREDSLDVRSKHLLKYLFPRQFRLHNVFTSEIDRKDTALPCKDYTVRDLEIARALNRWKRQRNLERESAQAAEPPLPKRLRGEALQLTARLIKRHSKCSYTALLEHYCPSSLRQSSKCSNTIEHATTPARVSAFCRAVVSRVFPHDFWGRDEAGQANRRTIMRAIDRLVRVRRYESLTVHDVMQHVQLQHIGWLTPFNCDTADNMSASDFAKRKELMAELLYYLFDSFLIPLIRGHFHVTESGAHRNQLFYFRHDVWRALSEPALESLKSGMLEECKARYVEAKLTRRALGVSTVRLLPKENGMRPIINLRRRMPRARNGQLMLGKSINSILTPAFSVLNYEKRANADLLASAMFSVEDIYPRLQKYRQLLRRQGLLGTPLFFANVDVRACFDTIPQDRLMKLVERILKADEYRISRYARGKLVGGPKQESSAFGSKPAWRYFTKATAGNDAFTFHAEATDDIADGRKRSIYVDGVVQKCETRKALLELLEEHIQSNLIKLGNKFYRQKEGIPQGSIVSSLLCSYFYAEMEREYLGFIHAEGRSVLLRLIDDFLVISTKKDVAERFLQNMHAGVPDFGVEVKAEKTRANFEVEVSGRVVEKVPDGCGFPYCGLAIDTVTLDLSRDQERRKKNNIADSMTVEFSRFPGQTFYRKTLNAMKLQMQSMLLSTSYNSVETVLSNLHHSFTEVAQKCYHYIQSLPLSKQPPSKLLIRTVDDMIKLSHMLMKRRRTTRKDIVSYHCAVTAAQARWIACTAFRNVFGRRQTKFRGLLEWIGQQLESDALRTHRKVLEGIAAKG